MLTRSQAKVQQQARINQSKQTIFGEPVAKQKETVENKNPVWLTEDLLYIVNKKLLAMDKEIRDDKVQNFDLESRPWMKAVPGPFTEVVYRKQNSSDLCQAELAVIHTVNFKFSSTAVCNLNSMGEFFHKINRAALFAKSVDYKRFLCYEEGRVEAPLKNPVARFMQLPKDYYRPHSDCAFFGELAWKENGVMTVEADNFALCLIIWTLKEWLANPIDNSYPLYCRLYCRLRGDLCCCRNLLYAMWTDDRLRTFLKDRRIFDESYDSDKENQGEITAPGELLQDSYTELQRAHREMTNYARKLITGEEMVSRSNRPLNVLAASQLQRILESFAAFLKSYRFNMPTSDDSSVFSD